MSSRIRNRQMHHVAGARHLATHLGQVGEESLRKRPPFLMALPPVGKSYKPKRKINKKLEKIIKKYSYASNFQEALDFVSSQQIPELDRIKTLDQFYFFLDALVRWIPEIRVWEWYGRKLHERTVILRLTQFYYYFNQPSLEALQSPIDPVKGKELTKISEWMWKFAVAWGGDCSVAEDGEGVNQ